MSTIVICLVLSIVAVLFSAVTAVFSFLAYSRVVGLENSTHKIEWMPVDSPNEKSDNDNAEEGLTPEQIEEKYHKELYKQFGQMYPDIEQEQV